MSSALTTATPETQEHDWLAAAQHIADIYDQPTPHNAHSFTDVYRVNRMLKLIAAGNYRGTAAAAAGFSRQHLANWDKAAQGGLTAAIALFDAIEKAEAVAESDAVEDMRKAGKAGPQFWAASATRLERRHPDRWGKRQDDSTTPRVVVQIGVKDGDVSVMVSEGDLRAALSPAEHQQLGCGKPT